MLIKKFFQLLNEVIANNLPDVHFTVGDVPYIRSPLGNLQRVLDFWPIGPETIHSLIEHILKRKIQTDEVIFDTDTDYTYMTTRFRVNISQGEFGKAIVMRRINDVPPSIEEIYLEPSLLPLLAKEQWLILITGATGMGKSTTLASMIEYINLHYEKHIITIEDPIEYIYTNKKSLFHQRELNTHTRSFQDAIKSTLRGDPDIIVIGEMRDQETFEAALTLAETGHLVLSTLHTNDAVQTIDRIIYSFPPIIQWQIRTQLAFVLNAIISQVLLTRADEKGRVAAREILINNEAVRSSIMSSASSQMYAIMELWRDEWMQLMDYSLLKLYNSGIINKDQLMIHLKNPDVLSS